MARGKSLPPSLRARSCAEGAVLHGAVWHLWAPHGLPGAADAGASLPPLLQVVPRRSRPGAPPRDNFATDLLASALLPAAAAYPLEAFAEQAVDRSACPQRDTSAELQRR